MTNLLSCALEAYLLTYLLMNFDSFEISEILHQTICCCYGFTVSARRDMVVEQAGPAEL